MKNFRKKLLIVSFLFLVSVTPAFAALVPACNPVGPRGAPDTCNLCHILELIKNLIEFLLQIGVVFAGLFIAWGAFVIMTAQDSEEKVKSGREIMTTAIWGVVIALSSWLIISTLLQIVTGSASKLPWTQIQCTF